MHTCTSRYRHVYQGWLGDIRCISGVRRDLMYMQYGHYLCIHGVREGVQCHMVPYRVIPGYTGRRVGTHPPRGGGSVVRY